MSQIIIDSNNYWRLVGELSFATAGDLLTELTNKISTLDSNGLTIDLSEVKNTDSAGLALLIELLRINTSITFCNIPKRILSLSNVGGVRNLLMNEGV
ncbi:MAG TPA: STAS domain-containing protein [Thioploca sp.]|nr:STAS domain-containing protein [Thioploca sp.]